MNTNNSFVLILFLAAFFWGCKEKQNRASAKQDLAPMLSPDTIQLGKITNSLDTTFSVKIFNPKDEPVIITAKAKSCGCTQLTMSKDTIPGHGSVTVEIGFSSANLTGSVTKSAFFRYNTGEISVLRILADIKPI